MKINGSTALVTGANRGLGRTLVKALRDAGCAKIYAAARNPKTIVGEQGIVPLTLDITDAAQVTEASTQCRDVDVLINNAGVAHFTPALAAPTMEDAKREMEVNYFGTLSMCRAFAPVLKHNGGGVIVNVLSVVSFMNVPMQGTYCASKAAAWSITKAVRFELRSQGTLVIGVYAGYIDTDMAAHITSEKVSPDAVAAAAVAGIENSIEDVLADERSRAICAELRKDDRPFDAVMQQRWDETRNAAAAST